MYISNKERFISFEGIDGCGKSTQAKRLARWLKTQKRKVVLTQEPGGPPLGGPISKWLLGQTTLSPWSELLLFQAQRAEHVRQVIRPALKKAKVVVCDRYADSTMAYQGYGLNMNRPLVQKLTDSVTDRLKPKLTIVLDLPPRVGLRRVSRRQKMERRGLSYQKKVRNGFLAIAKNNPRRCKVIPVQSTPEKTQVLIREVIARVL